MDKTVGPRKSGKCYIHILPKNYHSKSVNNEFADIINYIKKKNAKLIRGDMIIFKSESGYRENGKMLYDGTKIVPLEFYPDDYGNIPKQFLPIEEGYPLDYWHSIEDNKERKYEIQRNKIIWILPQTIKRNIIHIPNYSELYDNFYNDSRHYIWALFKVNKKKYFIVLDCYDRDYDLIDKKTHLFKNKNDSEKRVKELHNIIYSGNNDALPVQLHNSNTIYYEP
jgi:hypothetical protein